MALSGIIHSDAATITWAGHTWNVTTGGMAGGNTGSAGNVAVDTNNWLHLKISQSAGAWTCAELFSADNMGFGAYRWQVEGPVDKMDKNVVLGLFPYGPQGGVGADGTNEIDIEYARWGNAAWPNGDYTVYPNSGTTVGETTFNFSLNGTYTTSSFVWTSSGIAFASQEGLRAAGDTAGTIKRWTYAPATPSVNIPQRAMPLGMNLWLCSGCGGSPSNGQPVEIIVRSFEFIPAGTLSSVAQQKKPEVGRHVGIARCGGRLFFRFDKAFERDVSMRIVDMRGRVVCGIYIPANAQMARLPELIPGIYAIELGQGMLTRKTFIIY